VDASCSLIKQYWMLNAFLESYRIILSALEKGIPFETITALSTLSDLARLNEQPDEFFPEASHKVLDNLQQEIKRVAEQISRQRETLEKEDKNGSASD
jgi:hypothetical protein